MSHHLLCIDDETHNLEALERLLRRQYKVATATSGKLALEKMAQQSFSLIISDQKMPEMTGVDFFVEARKIQPDAIRILLTGYTDLESVIGAINDGQIYRYITKPWEPKELLGIIQQALEYFDLKQTVKKQNQELQQANIELQSLDKLKTDFMALVNHELKTPLTGIFSYVQLLCEEKLNDEQSLYVEKIRKNTRRLQELINDTLIITRIKSESIQEPKQEVNLCQMFREIWQQIQKDFSSRSLGLNLQPQNDPFIQLINQHYCHILIKKLIENCWRHSKPGSEVQVQLSETASHWSLYIENESANPLPENRKTLSQAFSKTGDILNHSGGAGLGLAVAGAVAHMLGGQIQIKGDKNQFIVQVELGK
jgi:two-component system, sensor histidine kinase and response regulator